jgi:hypothetical protein
LEVIRGLRELCEALGDQLADLRWQRLGTQFDTPQAAYRELIEAMRGSRDDRGKENRLTAANAAAGSFLPRDHARPAEGSTFSDGN